MNDICFPIGLNIKKGITVNMLCIKKNFDYHVEKRILDKIYSSESKSSSLKNIKPKKSNTRKNY
jgi:hypothetical protein